jgi:hypothetical protein
MKSHEDDVVIESFAKHPLVRNENLTDEEREKLAEETLENNRKLAEQIMLRNKKRLEQSTE